MSENAKQIAASVAGRRFIAQMNFYNAADFKRLRQFLHSGYYDLILMENPVERRLLDLKTARKLHGRLKVAAIEKADEYAIDIIMESERRGARLRMSMVVSEHYPHQILHYALLPLDDS